MVLPAGRVCGACERGAPSVLGVLVKKNRGFPWSQSRLIADPFLQSVVNPEPGSILAARMLGPAGSRKLGGVACRPHRGFLGTRLGKAPCSISCSGVWLLGRAPPHPKCGDGGVRERPWLRGWWGRGFEPHLRDLGPGPPTGVSGAQLSPGCVLGAREGLRAGQSPPPGTDHPVGGRW